MNWTTHQSEALKAVETWYKSEPRKQIFRVFGYAGVGKTSLAKHFAESIDGDVRYAAYTGKAALMMRNNGCNGASTIHSLIYSFRENFEGKLVFSLNPESPLKHASLLIIDECSMVGEQIANDILSFGVPVLVLGDPAQLPPVDGSTGYFTDAEPDVMLTEIHRQAKDNPIIHLATSVRESGRLDVGRYGDSTVLFANQLVLFGEEFLSYDQVLVGKNNTRHTYNEKIRSMYGIDTIYPTKDEKLICLRNNRDLGIFNGGIYYMVSGGVKGDKFSKEYLITDDDYDYNVIIPHYCFNKSMKQPKFHSWDYHIFDFGYAITGHKSQGSQWNDVLIVDESSVFKENSKRWLYTTITRAQNKVLVYKT